MKAERKKRKKIRKEKRWKCKQSHKKRQKKSKVMKKHKEPCSCLHLSAASPPFVFISLPPSLTLHLKRVLPAAFPNAVVSVADVDAVVGFVEHGEVQDSSIRFGQQREVSISSLPDVVSRSEEKKGVGKRWFKSLKACLLKFPEMNTVKG